MIFFATHIWLSFGVHDYFSSHFIFHIYRSEAQCYCVTVPDGDLRILELFVHLFVQQVRGRMTQKNSKSKKTNPHEFARECFVCGEYYIYIESHTLENGRTQHIDKVKDD